MLVKTKDIFKFPFFCNVRNSNKLLLGFSFFFRSKIFVFSNQLHFFTRLKQTFFFIIKHWNWLSIWYEMNQVIDLFLGFFTHTAPLANLLGFYNIVWLQSQSYSCPALPLPCDYVICEGHLSTWIMVHSKRVKFQNVVLKSSSLP